MKVRNDFVTNSSSSSFILAFKSKEDGISQIADLTTKYGNECIIELLKDFTDATPISLNDFAEHVKDDVESDAYYEMRIGEGGFWNNRKPTFENLWRKSHPNADWGDYYKSPEYKEEFARRVNRIMDEINAQLADNPYVVELEYEDHSNIGSELEHEILPECEFTVRRFSHH